MRKTARDGRRQDETELERRRYPRARGGDRAASKIPPAALDPAVAKCLLGTSEALAGVRYEALSSRVHAETRMPGRCACCGGRNEIQQPRRAR